MHLLPITEVAAQLGIAASDLVPYGADKAKVPLHLLDRPRSRPGEPKLVLVSAITPTPAGEGKTTTTIGLGQAMHAMGESVCLALREPSLGPVFGVKGGGTGGGKARIEPSAEINLHFTGDLHAITAANNLLAAMVDNHLHFGSEPRLNPRRVLWKRCLDMNDRSLRSVVSGLGGPSQGVPREAGFDITAASEVMAILCLAEGVDDLRTRLGRILVGFTEDHRPVTASEIGAVGAMVALLRDALRPNLVQARGGVPAFVHGGPFANIAHGCNSVLATRMALHHADWVITEAGFGFDLGGEKFLDIKCTGAGLDPTAVVLVATVRALKMHGGVAVDSLSQPDPAAVERGLPNLLKHLESVAAFGKRAVVAINQFGEDTPEEIAVVRAACSELGVPVALSSHFADGADGARELAAALIEHTRSPAEPLRPIQDPKAPPVEKIRAIATRVYGATDVVLSKKARQDLARIKRLGMSGLPVCMAKTQSSLSDDPKLPGRPSGFAIHVDSVQISAGAGFLVVLLGDMMRMPGLPRRPSALDVDVVDGAIVGVE